jgi:putative FmdB family regulatory protein
MPTYEYRCENGHQFEVTQRMADDPITQCTTCGAPVQRVFHPVAVHFKGSGFYNTDYGKRKGAGGSDDGSSKTESGKSSDSKSDSKSSDSKSSDSKNSDSKSSDSSPSKAKSSGGD